MSSGPSKDNATISVTAGAALVPDRRVKLNATNQAVYAGLGEDYIGVTVGQSVASGEQVAIKLRSQGGTQSISTAGAISQGAFVYGAANGQISATVAGTPVGVAGLGNAGVAASGADEKIEVFESNVPVIPVSYAYDNADLTKIFFVADRPYQIIGHRHRIHVVSGAGCTLTPRKAASGTALGSGQALLTAAIDLTSTANTNVATTLTATAADLVLAAGDALGNVLAVGTIGSAAGGGTFYLVPI